MELQLTRNYSTFHQGVGKIYQMGLQYKKDQKGMDKRFKTRWTLEIVSLHSNPDGITRDNESTTLVAGMWNS